MKTDGKFLQKFKNCKNIFQKLEQKIRCIYIHRNFGNQFVPVETTLSSLRSPFFMLSSTLLHPLYLFADVSTPLPLLWHCRQQQLLRQTDVLSTPPLSSVPEETQPMWMLLFKGPPGGVAGRRWWG